MSVRSQAGDVRRELLCAFYQRRVPLKVQGPIVTFTFDDFPRSALTAGAEILESFGARATYYVTMSLMNTANDLGEQFRREDLFSVRDRGHELANHTFSHLSARRSSCDAFVRDVEKGDQAIRETTGNAGSGNFAYPYGAVKLRVKRKLGPRVTSCRGTVGGFNGPEVDLNLLRANSLYGDIDCQEAAKRLILENEKRKSWLIFYTHDVSPTASRFGCSPQLLEAVCAFAAAHGSRFMTVDAVMHELGQQPGIKLVENLRAEDGAHGQLPMAYSSQRSGELRG